ncbi:MAG TPA: RecX family transcriptional regulator [Rhodothermales bacterium]|nr:RecX family transcriptional regulator [Rhodothermales bacterium]
MKPEEPKRERPLKEGKITRLAQQKRKPERVSVFVNGDFAFGVHMDLVLEHGLYKGLDLDVPTQLEIIAADRTRAANEVALTYLSYKARTEQEVRRKLARKDFDDTVADRTVARLHELGYLDDAAYAHSYVEGRFRNRGYGPQRLRRDLQKRGVAARHIDAALEAMLEEDDVLDAARGHAEKRWPRLAREPDPYKRRQKLTNYLRRRGFAYETIRRVVEEIAQQDEESGNL